MDAQGPTERIRLEKQLGRLMGKAVGDYGLLQGGDRVMVCLSGGKDSYAMISLLEILRRKSPEKFEIVAVHLDQGHPGYDGTPLRNWLQNKGFEHHILREDTYSVVTDKIEPGGTYCSLCSRLRRGILYTAAKELRCTKIALGHHRDDSIETLLLNLIFSGSLKAMPARLISDDGDNTVIRPLIYCGEEEIARYAELSEFPILPCDLCGSQEGLMRQQVKALLTELKGYNPNVRESMLSALTNVRPSHLLDRALLERIGIAAGAVPDVSPQRARSLGAQPFMGPKGKLALPVAGE